MGGLREYVPGDTARMHLHVVHRAVPADEVLRQNVRLLVRTKQPRQRQAEHLQRTLVPCELFESLLALRGGVAHVLDSHVGGRV